MVRGNLPLVIFDCNVLLQAMARPNGPSARAVGLSFESRVTPVMSQQTLREVRNVVVRPAFRAAFPELTEARVGLFLDEIWYRATVCDPVPRVFRLPRDPRDEPYLNLAAASGAGYLITRDRDLLSLPVDHSELGNAYRRQFRWLKIMDPVSFLGVVQP